MRPRNLVRGWRGWFAFVRAFGLAMLAVILLGCQTGANLLTDPLYIKCKGKGVTTIAAGPYAGTIQSDCGDGFEYSLERKAPK